MNTEKIITLENRMMKIFYSKIENKKFIHLGETLFSFETNDEIVKYCSEHGFNDVKFPFANNFVNKIFKSLTDPF